jgi:hypothetical protein
MDDQVTREHEAIWWDGCRWGIIAGLLFSLAAALLGGIL